jgi:hypothetical protein
VVILNAVTHTSILAAFAEFDLLGRGSVLEVDRVRHVPGVLFAA